MKLEIENQKKKERKHANDLTELKLWVIKKIILINLNQKNNTIY